MKKGCTLLAGILLVCVILAGNGTAWMIREKAYQGDEFSETKAVKKLVSRTQGEILNILYELFREDITVEAIASDSAEFGRAKQMIGERMRKYEQTNWQLRICNTEGEELFINFSGQGTQMLSQRHEIPTYEYDDNNNLIFASVFLEIYLPEKLSEHDELFELRERYERFRTLRWVFPAVGAAMLGAVVFLCLRQKRRRDGSFPGDVALLFGGAALAVVSLAAACLDWKGLPWGWALFWSELLGLVVFAVFWNLFPLVRSQISAGTFVSNLALLRLREQSRYVFALALWLLCEGGTLVFLFTGNSRERILALIQLLLLLLLLAFLLLWVRKTAQSLQEAVEERMKGERLKTELITNVSHDIKTPVTSILNYVDLLKRDVGADETVAPYIEVLDRQSRRLKKLVTEIVEASKAATGNIQMEIQELNLQEFLQQTFGEYEERLSQAGLTLVVGPDALDGTLTVFADGHYLWRIFDNLFSNICKYAKSGTRVYAELQKSEGMCGVTLKNISEAPLNISEEELFERFVRGDAARSTEGSGLGLTIAKSFAELMGGTLRIEIDGDMFKATVGLRSEK